MGNTTSDANRVERDLMARIDTLNANYSHLYKSYECKRHELNQIREENALLKAQMSLLLDEKNVENYVAKCDNTMLEDTFEKIYLSGYHAYLKTVAKIL